MDHMYVLGIESSLVILYQSKYYKYMECVIKIISKKDNAKGVAKISN